MTVTVRQAERRYLFARVWLAVACGWLLMCALLGFWLAGAVSAIWIAASIAFVVTSRRLIGVCREYETWSHR